MQLPASVHRSTAVREPNVKGWLLVEHLRVKGRHIVDAKGNPVILRGVCIGGWLCLENYILGFVGSETVLRRVLREELGEEAYNAFFQSLANAFITESDFQFLSNLGANVVRIALNYRLFEDDLNPGVYRSEALSLLDRAISWGRKYGIYLILELHAAPGWQNEEWHSDNPFGIALLWAHREFQQRVLGFWQWIAEEYKDEPQIAGYELLCDPNVSDASVLNQLYKEWTHGIRQVDPWHIIFLKGNRYSRVLNDLESPYAENLVYGIHNWVEPAYRAVTYPGKVGSLYADRGWLAQTIQEAVHWAAERGVPCWIAEFGALFDGPVGKPLTSDLARCKVLEQQIELFNEYGLHWTLWNYKDIGSQGLVCSKPDSEYLLRLKPLLELKARLGLDKWLSRGRGFLSAEVRQLLDKVCVAVADYSLDFQELHEQVCNSAVYGAVANFLTPLYARAFTDLPAEEIERIVEHAFRFEYCAKRDYLIPILRKGWCGE